MCDMIFAFETENLRVFQARVTPNNEATYTQYSAFLRDGSTPHSVAHAFVSDWRDQPYEGLRGMFCQHLERSALFPRRGFGNELFLGIEQHLGVRLGATAVTPDGQRFLERLGRPTDSTAGVIDRVRNQLTEIELAVAGLNDEDVLTAVRGAITILNDANQPVGRRLQTVARILQLVGPLIQASE